MQTFEDMRLARELGIAERIIYRNSRVSRTSCPICIAACDIYAGPPVWKVSACPARGSRRLRQTRIAIDAMAFRDTLVTVKPRCWREWPKKTSSPKRSSGKPPLRRPGSAWSSDPRAWPITARTSPTSRRAATVLRSRSAPTAGRAAPPRNRASSTTGRRPPMRRHPGAPFRSRLEYRCGQAGTPG